MTIKRVLPIFLFFLILVHVLILNNSSCAYANEISVSAPLYTDSAGFAGQKAATSIFRIVCIKQKKMGTGFLHKSGAILTAAHVIANCAPSDIMIILPNGNLIPIKNIISDDEIDIASLTPTTRISGDALPITVSNSIKIGAQVSTWGFPSGYTGNYPMLSVGYLSGIDESGGNTGKRVRRLVVNAAFNSGNSGGPLVDVESGTVIGIVSSKLAPIPIHIQIWLQALKNTSIGFVGQMPQPDGSMKQMSQSQVLEEILQYMRSQTQLVIGHAVMPNQLQEFLKANGLNKEN